MNLDDLDLDQLKELRKEIEKRIQRMEAEKFSKYHELEYMTQEAFKFIGFAEMMYGDTFINQGRKQVLFLPVDNPTHSMAIRSPYPATWDDEKIAEFVGELLLLDHRQMRVVADALLAESKGITYAQSLFMRYAEEDWPVIENFEVETFGNSCRFEVKASFTIEDSEYSLEIGIRYGHESYQTIATIDVVVDGRTVLRLHADCDSVSSKTTGFEEISLSKTVLHEMMNGLHHIFYLHDFPDNANLSTVDWALKKFKEI